VRGCWIGLRPSKILSSVRRVTVAATLALAAVLLAGCGGGADDHGKVEAGMHRYLVSLVPDRSPFPVGAGTPRVKDNSCKDRHVKVEKWHMISSPPTSFKMGGRVALWTCVVKVGTLAMRVNVVVDDRSEEVLMAVPGPLLKEDKPKGSQPPE
jgi:hypothetical protein